VKRSAIKRKTPLNRTSTLKRTKPMPRKGMALKRQANMRKESAQHRREREAFHKITFAAWGPIRDFGGITRCWFCAQPATVAMHIIPRSMLGKHRYACAEVNGRPGCPSCNAKGAIGDIPASYGLHALCVAVTALNEKLNIELRIEQFVKRAA
jgi:hypothetical protein